VHGEHLSTVFLPVACSSSSVWFGLWASSKVEKIGRSVNGLWMEGAMEEFLTPESHYLLI
jgi:hypothetical protein